MRKVFRCLVPVALLLVAAEATALDAAAVRGRFVVRGRVAAPRFRPVVAGAIGVPATTFVQQAPVLVQQQPVLVQQQTPVILQAPPMVQQQTYVQQQEVLQAPVADQCAVPASAFGYGSALAPGVGFAPAGVGYGTAGVGFAPVGFRGAAFGAPFVRGRAVGRAGFVGPLNGVGRFR